MSDDSPVVCGTCGGTGTVRDIDTSDGNIWMGKKACPDCS